MKMPILLIKLTVMERRIRLLFWPISLHIFFDLLCYVSMLGSGTDGLCYSVQLSWRKACKLSHDTVDSTTTTTDYTRLIAQSVTIIYPASADHFIPIRQYSKKHFARQFKILTHVVIFIK